MPLPWPCSNEIYEQRMSEVCSRAIRERIDAVAFGDLFLPTCAPIARTSSKPTGLEPLFPLWQIPTDELARAMIAGGLRARSPASIPSSYQQLLPGASSTPPCSRPAAGDRSLRRARRVPHLRLRRPHVYRPAHLEPGEIVNRDGFVFADFQ